MFAVVTCAVLGDNPGIVTNIFRKDLSSLPSIIRRGDIIRLHRAEFSIWNTQPQGSVSEKSGSFIIISGVKGGKKTHTHTNKEKLN